MTTLKHTTSEKVRAETRQYIVDKFIPGMKSEIENAWKEWAARPQLKPEYFEAEPWYDCGERLAKEVPLHNDETSERDLDSSLTEYMWLWILTRDSGDFSLGPDFIEPGFWGENNQIDQWIDFCQEDWDYECESPEDFDERSTHIFVEHPGIGNELVVGFYYWDGEVLGWEDIEKVRYVPGRNVYLSSVWKEWADEFITDLKEFENKHGLTSSVA